MLFGEEHFVKEFPEFLSAFFIFLHAKYGFNYLALESDPVSAQVASLPPLRGDLQALSKYARQYPNAFTFPTDQELQLFADAGRYSHCRTDPVWGLDQSFGVLHALDQLKAFPASTTRPYLSSFIRRHRNKIRSVPHTATTAGWIACKA